MESARHISLLSLFYFITVIVSPCAAATWYVDGSVTSSGDGISWQTAFRTIQEGVDAAQDGDVVIVAQGTYVEKVEISGKGITVQSTDPSYPIIVASTVVRWDGTYGSPFDIRGNEEVAPIIDGFTITGSPYSGVRCSGLATVERCVIKDNTGYNGGGVYCRSGEVKIVGCRISGNSESGRYGDPGGGIYVSKSSSVVIKNTIISGNTARDGAGIYSESENVQVSNCTIVGNIGTGVDGPITLTNCILWDNASDLRRATASYCCTQSGCPGQTNFSYFPHFINQEGGNFHLRPWSPCIDAGDPESDYSLEPEPNGRRVNVGAYGNTAMAAPTPTDADADGLPDEWEISRFDNLSEESFGDTDHDAITNHDEYLFNWNPMVPAAERVVNLSSGRYLRTVHAAIMESDDGDEIIVLPGIHTGGFSFNGRAVTVRSLDPESPHVVASTVIETTSGPAVEFEWGEGPDSVLAGLTIESLGDCAISVDNSSPLIQNNVITCSEGSGVLCQEGSPKIRDNTVTGCSEAIACTYSSALIVGNRILDNRGGVWCYGGFPTIWANQIAGNDLTSGYSSDQAAIVFRYKDKDYASGGFARIGRNSVMDNVGTGISCSSAAVIEGNIVLRNLAGTRAGGIQCSGRKSSLYWQSVLVIGNVVAENVGSPGGIETYECVLVSNTVVNNRSPSESGASVGLRGGFTHRDMVMNCIVWGHDHDLVDITAQYSCFGGARVSGANIGEDPEFVDPSAGDYHLLPTSPCIAAGWPTAEMPEVDIDLEPFPFNQRPDIGADQFTDADGDLLPDYWEIREFGTTDITGVEDTDNDGLSNLDELLSHLKYDLPDTDSDGLDDGDEVQRWATDPTNPDTDGDGLADGDEVSLYSTVPTMADTDGDGLNDELEVVELKTNPNATDTDGDGLPDGWEVSYQLSPTSPEGVDGALGDPDDDELTNMGEFNHATEPHNPDSDADGLTDGDEVHVHQTLPTNPDTDGDGLEDGFEVRELGTDPANADTDGDSLPDNWEFEHQLDPISSQGPDGPLGDPDGDGLTNLEELDRGTMPRNSDTDDDGMPDGWEVSHELSPTSSEGQDGASGDPDKDSLANGVEFEAGTDPRNDDSDSDGLPDGWEVKWDFDPTVASGPDGPDADADEDGLMNLYEYQRGTDPRNSDTDSDGLPDGWEVYYWLDPVSPEGNSGASGDPDHDGLENVREFEFGTRPNNADSDSDGLPDGWEIGWGLDPITGTGTHGPSADIDADGLDNLAEYQNGTDPGNADTDGDGRSDGDEVFAGTDPLDGESMFHVTGIEQVEGGRLRITWTSVPGKFYRVRYSKDLQKWKPVLDVTIAPDPECTFAIGTRRDASRQFFRVEVLP